MNLHALETAVLRAAILELLIGIIVLIVLFWATYWVIKAGVRDGIKEAHARRGRRADTPIAPPGYRWTLIADEPPIYPE